MKKNKKKNTGVFGPPHEPNWRKRDREAREKFQKENDKNGNFNERVRKAHENSDDFDHEGERKWTTDES